MHTLVCVTFSPPPGVGGWLRLLFVALPGLFCLPFYSRTCHGRITSAGSQRRQTTCLVSFRRNLRQASEETKTKVYSNLDYCTLRNPYQQEPKHQVEMVQCRATRFVTRRCRSTSSVTDMLNHLGWATLETRRSKLQLTVLFKIIHKLIDIPPSEYLTPASSWTRASHSLKYQQYSISTDCCKYSFFLKDNTSL